MATSFLDISAALDSNLNTYATANSIPVAWENFDYNPVPGTLYLRPTLLPASTEVVALGATAQDEHLGIYQIDIFAPLDQNKGASITTADDLADQFSRGTVLTYNGVNVRIRSVSRGSGSRDGAWFIVPVFISYRSHTQAR